MAEDKVNDSKITTERQILVAAEREFFAKGFAGARTTTIAEAAGVTHAMLHYYFRTKEKLFETILAEKAEALQKIFIGTFSEGEGSFTERISRGVARHFDFVSENSELPIFIFTEIKRDPERFLSICHNLESVVGRMTENLQKQIDEAAARGECRRMDAGQLLLDVASLNLFTFIASPVLQTALFAGSREEFLEARKRENIETILCRIKP